MPHGLPPGREGSEEKARAAAELQLMLDAFPPHGELHPHESGYHYSAGVKYLADHAGAYWLLDLIFARQRKAKKDARFRNEQRWELDVENQTLTCHGENASFTLYPSVLDFPLPTVTLLLDDDMLMLPSER